MGYSPYGCKESNMAEQVALSLFSTFHFSEDAKLLAQESGVYCRC